MDKKLLMIVVNRGFAEAVVEETRLHGATGATVLNGRGSAGIGERFMGMEITPEKEVILIITDSKIASLVHKKVDEFFTANLAAGGLSFVLPVGHMTGKEGKE
ncbi:MAG: P-II family nitrogen regulator [Christensenellaceae bacterium]|jgi:nitrogen regulatory protein PII|nr:P-II family nitrogen regulator [Christensenellaceae bacterium]